MSNHARISADSDFRFARRYGGDILEDLDDAWLPPRARRRQHAQRRPRHEWLDRDER